MVRLPLLLSLIALAGCASYRPPTVGVTGHRVLDATDDATQVGFELELVNPNDEPMKLLEFVYVLRTGGDTAYRGRRAGGATIAPRSARRLEIPAVLPAGAPAGPWRLDGEVLYLAPGALAEILFDTGLRRTTAGVHGAGDDALLD